MPVAKATNSKNFDIVIKSLRRREVSCQVAALPPKHVPSNSTNPNCENGPGSQSDITSPKPLKRRSDRKPNKTHISSEPKRKTRASAVCSEIFPEDEAFLQINEVPKKRSYQRKSLQVPDTKIPKTSKAEEPECLWVDDNANAPPTPLTTPNKRSYSRKVPAVPNNTPVVFFPACEREPASPSHHPLQQTVETKTARSECASLADDASTCTASTMSWDSGSSSAVRTPRRGRGRRCLWLPDSSEEDEEEVEVSEYELLRRKNVEENLKMLRLMFAETGFQLQKKPETPKSRRSYSKVPPPPPRPKSARLEVRRPSSFSRLTHNLSALT
ncbi:uncharacterized protein LOC124356478 [Homalodisca vitripennis]|uniref:uncharacterized protein LOC124356478 n=1 Tax=Homalodisca vitripennis TaxID=197043 RepID=UPI001EEB1EF7|nr:uncharacterized protein LOC124356478 [Homalodisca vitripennis]